MKIGVIGLGSIGMRHAKNLQELGHEVTGFDPDIERGRFFIPIDWREDAYVFATPTKHHYGNILDAALRYRHLFVEKPIAHEWHKDFHIVTMVGYNLRMHACVKRAKEWIVSGRIGKPLWANFTCGQFSDKPAYLRDGVILNWSHEIDLALHLLGPGHLEASSVRIVDGYDDMADILLTHESGCRSTIHLDYITKPEQRHFIVQGDSGRITCALPSRNLFLWGPDKEDSDWFLGPGSYDTDYMDEMRAFIDRIEGKDVPGCTGEEALRVLEVCLEVRRQAGL